MAKVDIVSGFLGAGKTTFIKQLIDQVFKGEKLVLIENEFGEIGIDGGFLKDAGVEITEMNSGCICCTLVGDFSEALKKVMKELAPDRVIIEPSGVGKLSDVVKAVEGVEDKADIEIGSAVTVVDGKKAKMYMKNFGEFFLNQVENAGTIVISRTQQMSDEKLEACVHMLREHNEKAAIITTPWDQLDKDMIRNALDHSAMPEHLIGDAECGCHDHHHDHDGECCHDHHHDHDGECCHGHDDDHDGECCHHHDHDHHHHHDEECGCHDHDHHHHHDGECGCHDHDHHGHHHADEVFTSWGRETAHKYSRQELEDALKSLSGSSDYGVVLRAKGIIQTEDGTWMQFDLVPEEYEIRQGSPDYTGKLCVIGTDLKEEKLAELFHV
ncbi:MAG TPA: GTP-binding protein [Candidatus Limivivens intestinipullorum]|uniref:GTP-binding protein n=1 Tax=Candidatus Limivivens intestinipullorum TaxID=2840858 RepID=A0A9D1EQF1_9FIRM|nr:GTP-binding protein [Candidatus Limivivens intestinipullorum]